MENKGKPENGDEHGTRSAANSTQVKRKVLFHITTVPESLSAFIAGQPGYMKARGFEVHVISSPGPLLDRFEAMEGVQAHGVHMPRKITPLSDLVSLFKIWRILKKERASVVHAHSPKGGLLGMLAALMAGVPARVYHLRGLPYMTASGIKRLTLINSERLSCLFAHRVICVSRSIRNVLVNAGLCAKSKTRVYFGGSGNGVDSVNLFNPEKLRGEREKIRAKHGIPKDGRVIGFVGRIVRDKGICELAGAWTILREEMPDLHMILVGPFESKDPVPQETRKMLEDDPRVHSLDYLHKEELPPVYAAFDVLAFPSHREGFGVVAIEASAMEIPVVATEIPGCVDSVMDSKNGILVPVNDTEALTSDLRTYLNDQDLREKHGKTGRAWVVENFRPEDIWEAIFREYMHLLGDESGKGS